MADVFYTSVVWTAGDVITEAKMDNMVANDRAVDAMAQGVELLERGDPLNPGATKLHFYAKDKSGVATAYIINSSGVIYELAEVTPTYTFPVVVPYVTNLISGPLSVIKDSLITRVRIYSDTAPVGADLIFDVLKNSSSIWGGTPANRIKAVDGSQTGTQTAFDTPNLLLDDILTLNCIQVGATTPGQNIVVEVKTK